MPIKPIQFSVINTTDKKNQKVSQEIKSKNIITNFPKGYGTTNLAFCGRHNHKKNISNNLIKEKNVELNDFLNLSEIRDNASIDSVPYFDPYEKSVNRALNALCVKKPVLVFYTDKMDSRELFINNLKKTIANGNNKARYFGIPRDTSFLMFNCADYNENVPLDALKDQITNGIDKNEKVILIGDEADVLFETLERPNDFLKSTIFKDNPTLFFVEDKYKRFTKDECAIMNSKFDVAEQRYNENPDLEYSKEEAYRLTSKKALLTQPTVELPLISYSDALLFLFHPNVQKHMLAQHNENIKYNPEAIFYALELANADLYYTDNMYGAGYQDYLTDGKGMALENAISLLQMATVDAMNNASGEVTIENIKNSYLYKENDIIKGFRKVLKEHNKKAKTDNNSQTQKNIKEIQEETDSSSSSNFSIIKNPKTKFSDIGGMFNVKRQLKEEFLDIMENKNIKNSQKPNGILLYGPPGCGKTLLAKAIAGEAGVPFVSTVGSSFVEVYVGTGPKRVRDLYSAARREAVSSPSKTAIVFIDEIDSAASSRNNSDGGSSEDLKTVDALLHEMDGTKNKGESDVKIVTVIATNNKDVLDGAITRNGRIDVKCFIDDPRFSEKARQEILNIHAKDLPFENKDEKDKLIDNLAKSTAGMSGADLAEVIKKAYRLSLCTGRKNIITQEDINEAKMRVKTGIKTDTEPDEYEKRQVVAREAGHAINSMILEKIFENEVYKHKMPSKVLDFISTSARGGNTGNTFFKPSEENKTISKESCLADVITLYGSYAAETQLFGTHTSNVNKDMEQAAQIIEKAIIEYDYGSTKRYLSLKSQNMKYLFSEEIKNGMEQFGETGMKISQQMIKFAKPFLNEYITNFMKSGSDKIVTAQEFKAQFNNWLENNNKQEEYKTFCKDIKEQINDFCKESETEKAKFGF